MRLQGLRGNKQLRKKIIKNGKDVNLQDQFKGFSLTWELEADVFFSDNLDYIRDAGSLTAQSAELEGESDACILQIEKLKPGMLNPVTSQSNDKSRISKMASKMSLGFKSSK